MPPPAVTGRPPLYCSLMCRRNHQWHADRIRWAEECRVEDERRAKEEAERAGAERRSNLAAGGVRRLQQLQDDAQDAGRCGWFEPGDDDVCQRRVTRAYLLWCREHTDREEKLEEEAIDAEWAELEDDAATPIGRERKGE